MTAIHYRYCSSPIGLIEITATQEAVTAVTFTDERRNPETDAENPLLKTAARQMTEYLDGTRKTFDLPLAFTGTSFQQRVWHQLMQLPFGCTASYADIAQAIGNPRAVRAVGGANGRNPLPIIVPCHRVIGRNGDLTGFGSGLWRKAWLLEHEGVAL